MNNQLSLFKKKRKFKRKIDYRIVKKHRNYTVKEASELLNKDIRTVYQWIKNGLPVIKDSYPVLIYGLELKEFIKLKQNSRRKKGSEFEIYCLKCRSHRLPKDNQVSIVFNNKYTAMVKALCPDCKKVVNKSQNIDSLPKWKSNFLIVEKEQLALYNSLSPLCNTQSKYNSNMDG